MHPLTTVYETGAGLNVLPSTGSINQSMNQFIIVVGYDAMSIPAGGSCMKRILQITPQRLPPKHPN